MSTIHAFYAENSRCVPPRAVFMGMGEPLLNLPSVLRAHAALTRDLGIGARRITVSTVGVPNAIARLAAADLQSTLAVSIHAANQQLREQLIPRHGSTHWMIVDVTCACSCMV